MKNGRAARVAAWWAAAVVGAAALGGCETASAPRLEHAAASVTDRTGEGVALSFAIDAYNDNDIALPLRDVTYTLTLDGEEVFSGTRSAEATLRRRGVQQIKLPAVIALRPGKPAPEGVKEFRLHGKMTYVTPGRLAELLFDTGVRVPSVGFETEGLVDLGTAASAAVSQATPARR